MAIRLEDKTNVTAPNTDYPYGDIKDNDGSSNGTPVNRSVYADFHQFFARLLDQASTVANGLLENATNGFQYFESLISVIRDTTASETQSGTVERATQTEVNTGTDTSRHLTPSTLSGRTATTIRTGITEIATQVEVNAGTDSFRYLTPSTLNNITIGSSLLSSILTALAETFSHRSTPFTGVDDSNLLVNKDSFGYVNFTGSVNSDGQSISGSTGVDVLTLDSGYRPSETITFITGGGANATNHDYMVVNINSSGVVNVKMNHETTSASLWQIEFSQIRFRY